MLTLKMRTEREKILKDNEEHLEEQAKHKNDNEDSDFEDEEIEGEDEEEDKEEKPFKKADKDELFDDSDDDSDYEYTGGDLAIYDSALNDVDELLFVKETLEKMNAVDAAYVAGLLGGMEELQKFNENMQTAQALKLREEQVRIQCDQLDA